MGVKLNREKKILFLQRFFYALDRLLPFSNERKLKLYLNLEWMFERFAHEYSYKNYTTETHPVRIYTNELLKSFINKEHTVLDLGCHEGEITNYLADIAKYVVGIDYNKGYIDLANKTYKKDNLEFICAEAHDYLQAKTKKFDVLVLSHILEHIDEPEAFLKKFTPFFNYVYIELPDFDKSLMNHYRKDYKLPLIYTDGDHVSEFDRYELIDIFNKTNLTVVHSEFRFGLLRFWCKTNKTSI
jgi:SAM-dependent methyltransferase